MKRGAKNLQDVTAVEEVDGGASARRSPAGAAAARPAKNRICHFMMFVFFE